MFERTKRYWSRGVLVRLHHYPLVPFLCLSSSVPVILVTLLPHPFYVSIHLSASISSICVYIYLSLSQLVSHILVY